jgi:predicted Fe-Mo cluster-binding NifX family protein
MQVATAPPIRPNAKAPHPDWGTCTTCHDVVGVGATRAAAITQVAAVAPPLGGVWLKPITPATAARIGLDNADGALVSGVKNTSTAYEAGLRAGDVIRRIDNLKVENVNEAQAMIAAKGPQDTIKMQILRDGRARKIFVKIPAGAAFHPWPLGIRPVAAQPLSGRVAVAATDQDLNAQVAPVFARAPAFILYDPATGRSSVIENQGAGTLTAGSQATSLLIGQGVGAVITGNMGPSSLRRLRTAGVKVYTGAFGPTQTAVAQYLKGTLVAANDTLIPNKSPAAAEQKGKIASKVAVASTGASLNAQVARGLGMAPYLIIYNTATGETEVVAKKVTHGQGTAALQTAHQIVDSQASAVIAGNVSPETVSALSQLGVFSFAGVQGSVGQAVQMYKQGGLRVTTVQAPARGGVAARPRIGGGGAVAL